MKSIRTQILIYLVIGTIVLAGVVFFLSELKLNELPDHIKAQYSEIVNARSDEVSKELKSFVEQITIISKSPIVRSMDLEKIKEYLPHLLLDQKYRNMTIAYPDGSAWSTVIDEFNISEQEQYRKIFIENKEYTISQPFRSPYIHESDEPIVIVAHSVVNDNDEVMGLVNVVVKIDFLNQVVKEMSLKGTGYGWIVNREGLVVAHPDPKASLEKNIKDYISSDSKTLDEILDAESGTLEYIDKSGERMLAFFSRIKGSPDWTFIVSVSENEIYKEINGVKNTILGSIIIALILLVLFGVYYSSSLSRPILELKEVFEKAANGNLSVKANEQVSNELGAAAKSFNIMLERIKHLTYKDVTTGLYNYNGFLLEIPHKINNLISKGDVISIAIISIDDFKRINSIYGYDVGDEVLHEFSKRLYNFVNTKELVARFLGDEFVLLLYGDDILTIEKKVRSLWRLCSGVIKIRNNEFILNTSIGASTMGGNVTSIEETINQATIAKLVVKKMGGHNYKFYNYELDEFVKEEQEMEKALYHAIENQELKLVYQPIIDVNTNEIVEVEALLRWTSPVYGSVSPLVLIQIAEQSGFIYEIGEWVLREACNQNKQWQEEGYPPVVVSVNVSALQFDQPNFVEMVNKILEDIDMDPSYLELEITETNAMDRVDEKLEKMESLKSMGVRISIDDFGTGYSSLAYFTRFPIDTLKIDRSFINDMLNDENAKTIVTTIINLAKTIKIKIIAEGVETVEQLEYLKQKGCDKIQGYYFSRPVAPDLIREMLKEDSKLTPES